MGKKTDLQIQFDGLLGSHLKALRISRGLSQEDMSLQLGIKRQQYAKMEQGKTSPIIYYFHRMLTEQGESTIEFLDKVIREFDADIKPEMMLAEKNAAKEYYKNIRKRLAQSND